MTDAALSTPPTAVLFDLDGTLCDSAEGIVTHLGQALAACGLTVPDRAVLRTCVGPRWEDGLPHIGVPIDRMDEVITAYRATYDHVAPDLAHPFDGITDMLGRLVAAGVDLAVATSKPHALASRIVLEGPLAEWLEVVRGSDPAEGRHTKADVVGAAYAALAPTGPAVMVGDRHFDIHGAAAHGLPGVGVEWGCAEPGELHAAGAVAVAESPAHLADILLAPVAA